MPKLIFLGENHTDPAAFNFLSQSVNQLRAQNYKIFVETSPTPQNHTSFLAVYVACERKRKNSFRDFIQPGSRGTPILKTVDEYRLFYNVANNKPSLTPEEYEFFHTPAGLAATYILSEARLISDPKNANFNSERQLWAKAKVEFFELACEHMLNVIPIDVERPHENTEGQAFANRTTAMFNNVRGDAEEDDNGIVITGLRHVLETSEGGVDQPGFESMCQDWAGLHSKFLFVYSSSGPKNQPDNLAQPMINQHINQFRGSKFDHFKFHLQSSDCPYIIGHVFNTENIKIPRLSYLPYQQAYGTNNISAALCLSSEKGYTADVLYLLDKGADVNTTIGKMKQTALHFAVKGGYKEIVELLLQQNPVFIKDKSGKHAFDYNPALFNELKEDFQQLNSLVLTEIEILPVPSISYSIGQTINAQLNSNSSNDSRSQNNSNFSFSNSNVE